MTAGIGLMERRDKKISIPQPFPPEALRSLLDVNGTPL